MDSEEKISFEMYVNRFCKTYNCTKEEALHTAVVKKIKEMYEENQSNDTK